MSKHRPASLDLDTHSSEAAPCIASPGLAPLKEELKATVKISQQIEQQQRQLIATRHSSAASTYTATAPGLCSGPNSSSNSSFLSTSSANAQLGVPVHVRVAAPTSLREDVLDDKLGTSSTPTTAKRLKRDNLPSPLNIASASPTHRPTIRSAPIRQPARHRRAHPPQYVSTYAPPNPVAASMAASSGAYCPRIRAQAYPHQSPYSKTRPTRYAVPPAPGAVGFAPAGGPPTFHPRMQRPIYAHHYYLPYQSQGIATPAVQHFHQLQLAVAPQPGRQYVGAYASHMPASSVARSVTDVYQGDYTRAAPPQAQPLSSQYEYFDHRSEARNDEDRITEDEIAEMQTKYRYRDQDGDVSDPESAALDDEDRPAVRLTTTSQIFGSINLMNESVFNFKIFKGKNDAKGERESRGGDADGTTTVDERESEKSGTEVNDWLAQEKAKFMKICETSWDEFIGRHV